MQKKIFLFGAALLLTGGCCHPATADGKKSVPCESQANEMAADTFSAKEAAPMLGVSNGSLRKLKTFQAVSGRKMAFSATLHLTVGDLRPALEQARQLAVKAGGFVRRMDNDSITLAIPAEKAETVLEKLKQFGKVTHLQVTGEDLTGVVSDTRLRLENLEKSRQRLLKLIEKAAKAGDLIQIERELTRITVEIESLQSKQKQQNLRVNFVTILLCFRTTAPVRPVKQTSPVEWVNSLGADLLDLNVTISAEPEKRCFALTLPAGFVQSGRDLAVSAGNCILTLAEHRNFVVADHWYGNDYAPLGFYEKMVATALKDRFGTKPEMQRDRVDGLDALIYTVHRKYGEKKYTFRAVIAVDGKSVKVLTARAETAVFNHFLPEPEWRKLLGSIRF